MKITCTFRNYQPEYDGEAFTFTVEVDVDDTNVDAFKEALEEAQIKAERSCDWDGFYGPPRLIGIST